MITRGSSLDRDALTTSDLGDGSTTTEGVGSTRRDGQPTWEAAATAESRAQGAAERRADGRGEQEEVQEVMAEARANAVMGGLVA